MSRRNPNGLAARSGKPILRWHLLAFFRAAAAHGVRRREFRFLRQDADRRHRAAPALEALRRIHRFPARRSPRPQVRGARLPAGSQGAHPQNGGRARSRARPGHPKPHLDVPRHQAAGARQAARHHQQNRLPRQVARLFLRRRSGATTPWATATAPTAFEVAPRAEQDRQARRPHRVGDDAAHRQRLLRSADEQHQLPRRHPAAALLRQSTWTTP